MAQTSAPKVQTPNLRQFLLADVRTQFEILQDLRKQSRQVTTERVEIGKDSLGRRRTKAVEVFGAPTFQNRILNGQWV